MGMTAHLTPIGAEAALARIQRDIDALVAQLNDLRSLAAVASEDIHRRPAGTEKDLLTVEEVAERLNLGVNSVYVLMREGKLAGVKIGRARRIPTAAVAAFLEALSEAGEVAI